MNPASTIVVAAGGGAGKHRQSRTVAQVSDYESSSHSVASPLLELSGIRCTFAATGKNRADYTAVRDSSFAIAEGEFVSIVGPTGCGKSTLLNVAAGLLTPSAGTVKVRGEPLQGLNRQAGYMFQSDALMPWRTALENVSAGLEYRGLPAKDCRVQALEWLARVGLGAAADRYPHQLSGGMRKRVALAQILVLNPRILLMDEPFSALDIQTREMMENELLKLWQLDRKSVLFITHDLGEAIALSDRVIVLSAGPAARPIGTFEIGLPRPRDVFEVQHDPRFIELHSEIWQTLKAEVLKAVEWTRAT